MALTPKNFTCSGGVTVDVGATLDIKLADMATGTIKGRSTAGTGAPEDLTAAQVRALADAVAASVVQINGNTTLTKAAHQGKLLYCTHATPGTTIAITLTVDGSTDFDAYAECGIYAAAGATVTVSGSGATVNVFDGQASKVDERGRAVLMRETAADTYILTSQIKFAPSIDALSDVAVVGIGDGELLIWAIDRFVNATLAEAGIAAASHTHAGVYEPVDADILRADTPDTLVAGFDLTAYSAGTKSSGTFTPNPANGNAQTFTDGGAFILVPPTGSCSMVLLQTNNGSAGAVDTSGFTVVTGDALDTTDTHMFLLYITCVSSYSHLAVVALQ